MVNISIYPYGNANERQSGGKWTFNCQHGANECNGNMVETCMINLAGFDQNQFMDFILQYEAKLRLSSSNPYATAKTVFDGIKTNVSWTDMQSCMGTSGAKGGKNGNVFEHQMALWTAQTHHQYTPWITLNGKHSDDIQNSCTSSTLQCTCNVYKGTNSCCKKLKEEPIYDVCYKEDKP
eukprot:319290_1